MGFFNCLVHVEKKNLEDGLELWAIQRTDRSQKEDVLTIPKICIIVKSITNINRGTEGRRP